MKNKINYEQIGSVLNARSTKDLEKSVAEEMKLPDGPLTIQQLTDMSEGGGGKINWEPPKKSEQEKREEEAAELDSFDEHLEEDA